MFYDNANLIDIVKFLIENGADVNVNDLLYYLWENYKNDNLIGIAVTLLIGNDVEVKDDLSLDRTSFP